MTSIAQLIQRLPAALTAEVLMFGARALTGVRGLWRGALPSSKQRVYFANHGSHGDFVLIWITLPGRHRRTTRPVAGQDYWLASPLRRFVGMQVFNALLIDRAPKPDQPSPVDQMIDALQAGSSLIIFPEGTRNTTDAPLLPFKSGLYHLSRRYPDVELIPVWIDNVRRFIPKGHWLPVPMICTVSFGAPLTTTPDEDKAAFIKRAEEAVLALRPQESLTC